NTSFPSKLKIILDYMTRIITDHKLLEIFSLKMTKATINVATISKLFHSKTLAKFVLRYQT
ncbi:MAG: hypothetical protein KH086_11320, partial [Coprobacillus sp.]|nr:hypothetical protein [Coprobacillus sp.]